MPRSLEMLLFQQTVGGISQEMPCGHPFLGFLFPSRRAAEDTRQADKR